MKKTQFYVFMVLIIIIGIFIDYERAVLREYSSLHYDLLPARIFDVFSGIVYIALVAVSTHLIYQNLMPPGISLSFIVISLLFLIIPLLFFIGLTLPVRFNFLQYPTSINTQLSGAFWLFAGVFHIFKYVKQTRLVK